jgi:hypothetical protein
LCFDRLQPGILAGRLVKMTMNADKSFTGRHEVSRSCADCSQLPYGA